jgi:hypothetical protein
MPFLKKHTCYLVLFLIKQKYNFQVQDNNVNKLYMHSTLMEKKAFFLVILLFVWYWEWCNNIQACSTLDEKTVVIVWGCLVVWVKKLRRRCNILWYLQSYFAFLCGAAISHFFTHYSSCHYSEPLDATIQADRRNIIIHSHSLVVVYM